MLDLPLLVDQPAFWGFINTLDILIDIGVTVLPVIILQRVQMTRTRKMNANLAFAGRMLYAIRHFLQHGLLGHETNSETLSVVPVTILRLVYIFASNDSPDPTSDYFNRVLSTEIATTFSIVFACISFIKPFLDSVETGVLASKLRTPSLGRSPDLSHHTKLQYAKNLFKPRRDLSEERRSPLVTGAQNLSGATESYVLSNTSEAQAWAEPVSHNQESLNDGIIPNQMQGCQWFTN